LERRVGMLTCCCRNVADEGKKEGSSSDLRKVASVEFRSWSEPRGFLGTALLLSRLNCLNFTFSRDESLER
jgi:hypothetical protein